MKTLALIALLSVLPRLCALTITHVGTSQVLDSGGTGSSFPLNFIWEFPQYQGTAPLLSVSITTSYTATVISSQNNPFSSPLVWNPSALITPNGYFVSSIGGPGTMLFDYPAGLQAGEVGESVVIAPGNTAYYRADLTASTSLLLTDVGLYNFIGNANKRLNLGMTGVSPTFYGTSQGRGVGTINIVYTTSGLAQLAQSVPDAGLSGLLLASSLVALLGVHRFRVR
jgi:hypothetical protein